MRLFSMMILCAGIYLLAGCGFEDSAEAYTGVWSWDSGSSFVFTCGSITENHTLRGNESFIRGSSSDLVMSGTCNLRFDVTGDVANLAGSQTCTSDEGTKNHWTSWTFTRSGESMTTNASGTAETDSLDCSISVNGALTRVGS